MINSSYCLQCVPQRFMSCQIENQNCTCNCTILIHSSSCVLNLTLLENRPNFLEVFLISVTHLPNGSGYFQAKPFPVQIPQHFSNPVHSTHTHLHVKMEKTECSETSAYKLQTPWNCPKESIQLF
jgi:hypothetical protein